MKLSSSGDAYFPVDHEYKNTSSERKTNIALNERESHLSKKHSIPQIHSKNVLEFDLNGIVCLTLDDSESSLGIQNMYKNF
jgi:hypothetical protein